MKGDFMNNNIKFPRGNTAVYEISVNVSGELYTLDEGDKIIFTVKKNAEKNCKPVIEKILTYNDYDENGILKIRFNPEDTVNLRPCNYIYDCGLQFADDEFYTFISKSDFIITEAVSEKK